MRVGGEGEAVARTAVPRGKQTASPPREAVRVPASAVRPWGSSPFTSVRMTWPRCALAGHLGRGSSSCASPRAKEPPCLLLSGEQPATVSHTLLALGRTPHR